MKDVDTYNEHTYITHTRLDGGVLDLDVYFKYALCINRVFMQISYA